MQLGKGSLTAILGGKQLVWRRRRLAQLITTGATPWLSSVYLVR